ncbi:hypothetical protein STEG23_037864 [Scotinomys teguina]
MASPELNVLALKVGRTIVQLYRRIRTDVVQSQEANVQHDPGEKAIYDSLTMNKPPGELTCAYIIYSAVPLGSWRIQAGVEHKASPGGAWSYPGPAQCPNCQEYTPALQLFCPGSTVSSGDITANEIINQPIRCLSSMWERRHTWTVAQSDMEKDPNPRHRKEHNSSLNSGQDAKGGGLKQTGKSEEVISDAAEYPLNQGKGRR